MRAALTNDDEQKNDTEEEEVEKRTKRNERTERKQKGDEQRQSGVSHRTDSRILKSPDREMEREMKRNQ